MLGAGLGLSEPNVADCLLYRAARESLGKAVRRIGIGEVIHKGE